MPFKNVTMLTDADGPHDTATQLGFTPETVRLMLTIPLQARLPASRMQRGSESCRSREIPKH